MADRGREPRSRSPPEGGQKETQPKHKSKKEKKAEKEQQKAAARKLLEALDSEDSDDLPTDGSASAGTVALLTTDNSALSLDFINSLASSINDLTTAMKEVQVGMKSMQKESQEQRSQIAVILGELQGMKVSIAQNNAQYQADMDKMNADINERIAKLRAAAPPIAVPAPRRAASSSGRATSPTSTPTPGGHRPTRLWLKGFRETLTSKFLNDYANKAVARLPPEHRVGAKPGAPGFGAVVYVDYPPGTLMTPIKKAFADLQLAHVDDEGKEHPIRVATDQPLAVRHKGRLLGELWKLVEPHLATLLEATCPRAHKLGTSNGKLFLVVTDRPVELFSTALDDQGNLTINGNKNNVLKYGITEAIIQSWITTATRAAERAGQ
jgi:hypothetical protein